MSPSAVVSSLEELRAARPSGAPWLQDIQDTAWAAFAAGGLPTTRDEHWKYTNLRMLDRLRLVAATGEAKAPPQGIAIDACTVQIVNGERVISGSALPAGITLTRLDQLDTDRRSEVETEFARHVDLARHSFAALNTAFAGNALVLRIERDAAPDRPVLFDWYTSGSGDPAFQAPRLLVLAGRNSRLTLIEHHHGADGSAGLTTPVTEIALEDSGFVEHCRIQREPEGMYHVAGLHATVPAGGRLVSHNVQLGGKLARTDIDVKLTGPGAEVEMNGIYVAGGNQHIDMHTRVDHLVPHTTSREIYKGVLNDRARAVFNGKALVHPDAVKTDASQVNHNLLLSPQAEIDTKPELEIYADDVKCTHGATTGRLDETALFYLCSRGIDAETARSLLIYAFVDEVLARIDRSDLRHELEHLALGRLPDRERIEAFL